MTNEERAMYRNRDETLDILNRIRRMIYKNTIDHLLDLLSPDDRRKLMERLEVVSK